MSEPFGYEPTEEQFQGAVIQLAKVCGWRVAHFRPAMTKRGTWVTPVAADGKGFPDMEMLHPARGHHLYRELKTDKGRLTLEQEAWLLDLTLVGRDAAVWRPKDWPEIERTLKGECDE